MVEIRIDHKLRIALPELPQMVHDHIVEALSIPNAERQKAMEQNIWGWRDMPETIPLWRHVDGYLEMPRGFRSVLVDGLRDSELEIAFADSRFSDRIPSQGRSISLRPWQEPAVEAILRHEDGIWKSPAGSGKTVGVLEAIRRAQARSIVLVNTKDILWQWQDRARTFLGIEAGAIGDGVFMPSDFITVATVQTLHSRFVELEEQGFFDSFAFVCLDECHHATAETYNRLVDRFSSRYRIGVSATPDKTGDFALATNVLGPVFHTTRRRDVTNLIDPDVYRIPTSFNFEYRGAKGRRPSNYSGLIEDLVQDDHRNDLIVKAILIEEGSRSLVVSKRLEHLEILKRKLIEVGYQHQVLTLVGKMSSDDRRNVVKVADSEPCVIFSTLADEALDIPRLDRLFLVYPQRNAGLVEQQVGRICRNHPEKDDAKVIDLHDHRVGPLDAQWRVRRRQVYQQHGYHITTVLPETVFAA